VAGAMLWVRWTAFSRKIPRTCSGKRHNLFKLGHESPSMSSLCAVSSSFRSSMNPARGDIYSMGERQMNRSQFGASQQPHSFHGGQHREIGLRAVAAAVLYQGSNVERTISREISVPTASTTRVSDPEP
jgi:hypothetical protein